MARHVEAWMDGVQLSAIGAIIIQDVEEAPADYETTYSAQPVLGGRRVLSSRRRSMRVTITAAIRELYDLKKRTAILASMASWCSGTYLELSNHPGQRLRVTRAAYPALGMVRNYTQQIQLIFEANEIPWWEETLTVSVTGTGASGAARLMMPGNGPECPVDVIVTPSGTLTSLAVSCASGGVSRGIYVSGISVSAPILFTHNGNRLDITCAGQTLLPYRSEGSNDDLIIPAGLVVLAWDASGAVSIEFKGRGRWL